MIASQMPLQEADRAIEAEELLHRLIESHNQEMSSPLQVQDGAPNLKA